MDEIEKKAREMLAAELGAFPESCTREVVMTSALRAIAAALRSAQVPDGWVKVADGLPGPSDHVEVWPDPRDDTHSFFAHYDGGTDGVKAGRWYYNDRHGYNYEIKVTHWRRVSTPDSISAPSAEGE